MNSRKYPPAGAARSVALAMCAGFTVCMGFAACAGLAVPAARAADVAALVSARRALQAGFDRQDLPDLKRARASIELLSQLEPKSADLHYWLAFANWRLAPFEDKDAAAKTVQAVIDECEAAGRIDPGFTEAAALRANAQGMLITYKPAMAVTLGPRCAAGVARARQKAPDNPRVWLLSGIVTLHMPAFVGGGADKALEQFQKAEQLYSATPADSAAADWGRDDVLIWEGQAAAENGQPEQALDDYQRALKLNPGSGWARSLLDRQKSDGKKGTP